MQELKFKVLCDSNNRRTERAICRFPNGFGASIIKGYGSITDELRPYELAILRYHEDDTFELVYPDFTNGDVIKYLSIERVYDYLKIIQSL